MVLSPLKFFRALVIGLTRQRSICGIAIWEADFCGCRTVALLVKAPIILFVVYQYVTRRASKQIFQRFIWMRLFSLDGCALRKTILLAPRPVDRALFSNTVTDCSTHHDRLIEAQRLRGRIAVQEGAVDPAQLSPDGRHVQAADQHSWHVLTLDAYGQVAACARYLPHCGDGVRFHDLAVSHTTLAQSTTWGRALRSAVEADLRDAKRRGCSYVELGGWVISEALRCTTEALRTVATAYAIAQLLGGAVGITTASTRRCSATILKRVGGQRLRYGGVELPPYFDEHYRCEMEVLRFDSSRPSPRYHKWINACRLYLRDVPVICRDVVQKRVSAVSSGLPHVGLSPMPGFAT